jgi:hypothetical protein
MNELVEIIFLFLVFSVFGLAPLNIIKKENLNFFYNLIINLNVLLLLSLLPIRLNDYVSVVLLILSIFLIKNYFNLIKDYKGVAPYLSDIFFIFLIFFILSIQIASELNLGWDAKWFWYIKSLFYSQGQTFKELSNYVYNDYHPHLGSFIWAFFKEISINKYEYSGRLFYLFFYLSGVFLISKNIFKFKIKNYILFIAIILLTQKYIYFSGLQEILIFTSLVFISKFIYNFVKKDNFISLFFISLSMNLLIWIKAEGLAYALICLIIINLIPNLKIKKRLFINSLFLFMIIFKIIIYEIFQIKINDQPYYLNYILGLDFEILFYKIKNIVLYLSYYSFKNIILLAVPLLLIFNYKEIFKDNYIKLITFFFLLNMSFIFSAYIFREMDIEYALKTTIDRLIFSSSGFYLVFIINQIKKMK